MFKKNILAPLLSLLLIFSSTLFIPPERVSAEAGITWTERTSSGSTYWRSIASSSDGTKLVAVTPSGYIWTSTNSGATWSTQSNSSGQDDWQSIASNSTGQYLVAGVQNGYIWTSSNYGAAWFQRAISANWRNIASSSSGEYLAAVDGAGDYIWTSDDYGITWSTQSNSSGQHDWTDVASSSTGEYLVAVAYNDYIYTSDDYGASWNPQNISAGLSNWRAVSSSSSGQYLTAVVDGGYIWTSTDYGLTWSTQGGSSNINSWYNVDSSADGIRLIAGTWGSSLGLIYTSDNSGASWTAQTSAGFNDWISVASSSDGTKLAIGGSGGYIYTGVFVASAPTLTTTSATSLTTTTATLNGNITDTGGSDVTTRGFQYGTTSGSGNQTSAVAEASGPYSTGTFALNATSLTCGTTYYFRSYAINSTGPGYGSEMSFQTSSCLVATPSSGGGSSGGSILYGCKDPNATNYNYFSMSNPALCKYANTPPVIIPTAPIITSLNKYIFSKHLEIADKDFEVIKLQEFLNRNNFIVSTASYGSPGNEISSFGKLTKQALIKFQLANGLEGDGVLGPATRAKINEKNR